MNRTTPLPLTGGIPQPLEELADCILSAECELALVRDAQVQGDQIGPEPSCRPVRSRSSSSLGILIREFPEERWFTLFAVSLTCPLSRVQAGLESSLHSAQRFVAQNA